MISSEKTLNFARHIKTKQLNFKRVEKIIRF
ncbi:MAG: hypothetical protein RL757_2430 [Bacteroidota bacterium]|jgi:hypothetical protein